MTEAETAEVVASVIAYADDMANKILAAEVPDICTYRALHGLVAWGRGSGHFIPSDRHERALRRLPADVALKAWAEQEARLAAIRRAS
jgi:hypothetical protein